jgi:hypothetical protein
MAPSAEANEAGVKWDELGRQGQKTCSWFVTEFDALAPFWRILGKTPFTARTKSH